MFGVPLLLLAPIPRTVRLLRRLRWIARDAECPY